MKMDKSLKLQGAPVGVLSICNRRLPWTRLSLLALLLTLAPMGLQSKVLAQSCVQQCYQDYIACLHSGPGVICDSSYDACLASCAGTSRRAAYGITLTEIAQPRRFTPLLDCRPVSLQEQGLTLSHFGALRLDTAFDGSDLSLHGIRLFE